MPRGDFWTRYGNPKIHISRGKQILNSKLVFGTEKYGYFEVYLHGYSILNIFNLQDVAEQVNKSNYGLAAGIYTTNLDKAHYLSHAIRAGSVWINCYNSFDAAQPFGGYKESGSGRELGEYGLEAYTEVKAIVTKIKQKNS